MARENDLTNAIKNLVREVLMEGLAGNDTSRSRSQAFKGARRPRRLQRTTRGTQKGRVKNPENDRRLKANRNKEE